jgi:hypothetical protein
VSHMGMPDRVQGMTMLLSRVFWIPSEHCPLLHAGSFGKGHSINLETPEDSSFLSHQFPLSTCPLPTSLSL